MHPLLMIIDMQNGFAHPKGSFGQMGFAIERYRAIIPAVQELLAYFRTRELPVYFTKAIREASGIDCLDRVHKILPESRRERIQKIPLCIRGTWDADILDELVPLETEHIVEKRRDSAFQDTELDLWLRALRVDTLIFCGIDTFICVDSTLRNAFNLGYDVLLAGDAVASTRPELHRATIEGVSEAFGLVKTVAELTAFLDEQLPAKRDRAPSAPSRR